MEPTAQNKNYVQASGQMGPNDICGPQDTETDPHAFKPIKVFLMFTLWLASVLLIGVVFVVSFCVATGRYDNVQRHTSGTPIDHLSFLGELFESRLRTYNPQTGYLSAFYMFTLINLTVFGVDMYAVRREQYKQLVILVFIQLPIFAIGTIFEDAIGIDCRLLGLVYVQLAFYTTAVRRKEKRRECEENIEQVAMDGV